MNICVIGAGYVGLTLSITLASLDHQIQCVDKDSNKITQLEKGVIPFYEPELDDLLQSSRKNITFTTNISDAVKSSDLIFIAVGTPSRQDGSASLLALYSVLNDLSQNITTFKTIIVKSTVPPGTCEEVHQKLAELGVASHLYVVASNPEFLREGNALHDTLHPDKTVVGIKDGDTTTVPLLKTIYEKIPTPYIITNLTGAELIKYANNYFLATKISFINEMARVSDKFNVEISHIAQGIGLDPRIGKEFLQAGIGYGGSCFPKDLKALQYIAKINQIETPILHAVQQINDTQINLYVEKIKKQLPNLSEKIAVLGVTFKAHTDDTRSSQSIALIQQLATIGYDVNVYDPKGTIPTEIQSMVTQHPSMEDAIKNSHSIILATDWPEFVLLPWKKIKEMMAGSLIVDGRNVWDKNEVESHGFTYIGVGRR